MGNGGAMFWLSFPLPAPVIPAPYTVILALYPPLFSLSIPVIPAKAGIQRVGDAPGSAGVPARNAALGRGGTLTLALSHKGLTAFKGLTALHFFRRPQSGRQFQRAWDSPAIP